MLRSLVLFTPGANRHTVFQLRADVASYEAQADTTIVRKIEDMGHSELLALGQDAQLSAFCRASADPDLLNLWESHLTSILGEGPENELKPLHGFTRFDQLLGLLSYQQATENFEKMSDEKRFELLLTAVRHGHYHAGVKIRQLLEAEKLSGDEKQKLTLLAGDFVKLHTPGCILLAECMSLMQDTKQSVYYFYLASMLTDVSQNAFHNALLSSDPTQWNAQMMMPATNAIFERYPNFTPSDITDYAQTAWELSPDDCQSLRAKAQVTAVVLKAQLSVATEPSVALEVTQPVMSTTSLISA